MEFLVKKITFLLIVAISTLLLGMDDESFRCSKGNFFEVSFKGSKESMKKHQVRTK